jgi:hypothetical protein
MVKPTQLLVGGVALLLLLAPLAGCGDGDDEREDQNPAEKPVDGTFVGKLTGTDALVAVVASPGEKDPREARIYISDGTRVSEWFEAEIQRNSFDAKSDEAQAGGKLAGSTVKGSVKLPGGKSAEYEAARATGASGLYELTISRKGTLSGASAAGVALKSKSRLSVPGRGTVRFADGERRSFKVTAAPDGDRGRLRSGQIRLIVLPDGALRGGGLREPGSGDETADFFVKSLPK